MAVAIIVPKFGGTYQLRGLTSGGGGGGGFALVASVNFTAAAFIGSGVNTTSAIDTTGANLLIAYVNEYTGYSHSFAVSDSKSNTWTPLTAKDDASSNYSQLFYCAGPTVGSGHTFSIGNGGAGNPIIAVQAWSGANVSPFDVQNGSTAGATTIQPGSVTPSNNNSLIVCGFSDGSATSYSINGGYTTTDNDDASSHQNQGMGLAYLVQTSAAATNPTWTAAVGGATFKTANIAVFKP